MNKPFIWLLCAVISGCAAAPSATPVYAAALDHQHAGSTEETDAIEQVAADLKAVQTTLATQDPADIHDPVPSATPSGGHVATKGMGKTARGIGKSMSVDNAVQNQGNDEPLQSGSKQAAMNNPGVASSDKGHGMSGQSSMNMSADGSTLPPSTNPPPTATGQSNTGGPMKGKENGMSGQPMGDSANGPADTATGTMGGGMGKGSASKPKGMGGMNQSKGMGSMNMGSAEAMPSGSMGMCCGRMGSMMGKPKMTAGSTTPDPTLAAGGGHVLHLGERDFYLDLQSELALTDAQIQSLTAHRDQWLSERANHQSAIDAAETQVWQLTQALTPNPDRVAAAVREVEQLRSSQRLAFIASVSEAVKTLTPAQIATARSLAYDGAP